MKKSQNSLELFKKLVGLLKLLHENIFVNNWSILAFDITRTRPFQHKFSRITSKIVDDNWNHQQAIHEINVSFFGSSQIITILFWISSFYSTTIQQYKNIISKSKHYRHFVCLNSLEVLWFVHCLNLELDLWFFRPWFLLPTSIVVFYFFFHQNFFVDVFFACSYCFASTRNYNSFINAWKEVLSRLLIAKTQFVLFVVVFYAVLSNKNANTREIYFLS